LTFPFEGESIPLTAKRKRKEGGRGERADRKRKVGKSCSAFPREKEGKGGKKRGRGPSLPEKEGGVT